jgi:Mycothiol maleylpyruvate isomerase N-terminal domain
VSVDVDRLLREEDEVWALLLAALAEVPGDRFGEPTLTPEGWSVKDAMFHVAYWLDDCVRVLNAIADGTFDAERENGLDIQTINDEGFERSADMDGDTVRTSLALARTHARAAFTALAPVTPEAWEWFEESGPLHYSKHLEDLRVWLRG